MHGGEVSEIYCVSLCSFYSCEAECIGSTIVIRKVRYTTFTVICSRYRSRLHGRGLQFIGPFLDVRPQNNIHEAISPISLASEN